ncbi:MAG: D-2-hydroxyacid dehydrogenase [Solobacterium sp.]|nr:D-2-hydroxyacid dehydrogenase [Solobacterium sp.]
MGRLEVCVLTPFTEWQKELLKTVGGEACSFHFAPDADMLKAADVIISNPDPAALKEADHLQWLQLTSAGADPYVKPGVLPEQTKLTNASGAYGVSVSDHMMAMTYALLRNFNYYSRRQKEHLWQPGGTVRSIEECTVLVMGLGDIGGRYARQMKALGAKVLCIRRTLRELPPYVDAQYTLDDLADIAGQADIIANVLPGGPATEHVISREIIARMKPDAVLINAGRGNAIDPAALKEALKEGRIGGAGLDVTEPEPLPADDELWDYDNVIITPHVAGQFYLASTLERITQIAAANLTAFIAGEPLTHVVNKGHGY